MQKGDRNQHGSSQITIVSTDFHVNRFDDVFAPIVPRDALGKLLAALAIHLLESLTIRAIWPIASSIGPPKGKMRNESALTIPQVRLSCVPQPLPAPVPYGAPTYPRPA
jgi:hypothetical protein